MSKGLWTGLGVGAMAVGAFLLLVPVVPVGAAEDTPAPVSAEPLRVESPAGPCTDVEVSALLEASAHRPVLDAFGLTRLTDITVSEITVVSDPACGDAVDHYTSYVRVAADDCDETLADGANSASLCDGTAVALRAVSGTGAVSQQGVFNAFPLGSGWAGDGSWCASVEASAEFFATADGEGSETPEAATGAQLCLTIA